MKHVFATLCLALVLTVPHPVQAQEAGCVRIARLQIKPGMLEAFTAVVKEEMQASLREEPNVLALYAAADTKDPNALVFFELYVNETACEAHRQTPHFIRYFEATKDMISERVLLEAVPVELQDRHGTRAASR